MQMAQTLFEKHVDFDDPKSVMDFAKLVIIATDKSNSDSNHIVVDFDNFCGEMYIYRDKQHNKIFFDNMSVESYIDFIDTAVMNMAKIAQAVMKLYHPFKIVYTDYNVTMKRKNDNIVIKHLTIGNH